MSRPKPNSPTKTDPPSPPEDGGRASARPVRPVPRRWFWRKVIGIPLVAILLGTMAARVWWGIHADAVLEGVLDEIRARGEPVTAAEMARKPVPEERIAAVLYQRADTLLEGELAKLPLDDVRHLYQDLSRHPDFRHKHRDWAGQILRRSQEPLRLCRRARSLPQAEWKHEPITSGDLGHALCLAAVSAHEDGRDAEAVEYLRDVLALARAQTHVHSLTGHLQYAGLCDLAVGAVEQIAPALRIADDDPATSPAAVRALIAELLAEGEWSGSLVNALIYERNVIHDKYERVKAGHVRADPYHPGPPALRDRCLLLAFRPMYVLDQARAVRYMDRFVQAARAGDWGAALSKLPGDAEYYDSGPRRLTHVMSSHLLLGSPAARPLLRSYRSLARRRMAAVAVAIRLHETAHGRPPAELGDLVGGALAAVPPDPFSPTAAPPRYKPATQPPLLYCLGPDRADDGGGFVLDTDGAIGTHGSNDELFFLDGKRPMGTPFWERRPLLVPGLGTEASYGPVPAAPGGQWRPTTSATAESAPAARPRRPGRPRSPR